MHTDAPAGGLGCALYQVQGDKLCVSGYGSQTLTAVEHKHHSSKLEFLAVTWAICEHFKDYLHYSPHFDVYTDFNPLTHLLTTTKVNATGQRWVSELSNFSFSTHYHYNPGVENVIADSLSGYPALTQNSLKDYNQHLDSDGVRHIYLMQLLTKRRTVRLGLLL